jgi:hypothetical protein
VRQNSAPGGIGGIKQGRKESNFQDSMMTGASSMGVHIHLTAWVNQLHPHWYHDKNPKIHFNDETLANSIKQSTQQGGK